MEVNSVLPKEPSKLNKKAFSNLRAKTLLHFCVLFFVCLLFEFFVHHLDFQNVIVLPTNNTVSNHNQKTINDNIASSGTAQTFENSTNTNTDTISNTTTNNIHTKIIHNTTNTINITPKSSTPHQHPQHHANIINTTPTSSTPHQHHQHHTNIINTTPTDCLAGSQARHT